VTKNPKAVTLAQPHELEAVLRVSLTRVKACLTLRFKRAVLPYAENKLDVNLPAPSKKEWNLTGEAFDQLLRAFDTERDNAAQKYECMRRKLVEFFEARGSDSPPDSADEAINRVARRISEGEQIDNLNSYFYGVARLIWLEGLRSRQKEPTPLEPTHTPVAPNSAELKIERQHREDRLNCLESCLSTLSPANRILIVEYYREEKGIKIEHRKQQAERLNTTLNGLRLRASRIRAELSECVHSCLDQVGKTRNQTFDTD
jgi:DNA-directed RNA polymerase specialized sigma24 family protein